MRIDSSLTDDAVLAELGARLAHTRLERNLTQRRVADEAGVARSAVQALERGEPVVVTSLIRVLRALGLVDGLDRLVPEPAPSPTQLLALRGRRRRRAAGARTTSTPETRTEPWSWGDG
jgi:transcriptional regulator with XRE-family HTH domain